MTAPEFLPGTEVVVVAGLSKGERGVVWGRIKVEFDRGVPQYTVQLPEGARVFRADYLRPAEGAS